MVNAPSNSTEGERRQAYLRCVCATLNFDVGEIWSWRNDDDDSAEGDGDGSNSSNPMRFVQLYTSPSFRNQRSKLVKPSEDWDQSHTDVSKHKFSPLICEAVRDGGGVVWANTEVQEGLLGRSDLPLRTAVGAPVYTQGRELGVLVLFSPAVIQTSSSTMEFLYTLAQAASSADTTDAFLPALTSSFPVGPPPPPPPTVALGASAWWRRGSAQNRLRRLEALRASLPVDVMFQTLAMGQAFNPERSLRAVRSVYNDPSGRVVLGSGRTIPAEFFRPGGGLVQSNRDGGSSGGGGAGFIAPGTLSTADLNTTGGGFGGGGAGAWGEGMGVMSMEDGGAGGAGSGFGNAAGGSGWLARPGEDGGAAGGESGGGVGMSQAELRRGSFQSNASVDFGLLSVCGDESVLDSEEYGLWAAFMNPDSPAFSPCPSPSANGASATETLAGGRGGGREESARDGPADTCSHSPSYQTLSELLSTNANAATAYDCDRSDDGGDSAAAAGSTLLHDPHQEQSLSPLAADFSELKHEFDDRDRGRLLSGGEAESGGGGGGGGGGATGRQSYPFLTEKKMFFPPASTAATTTTTGAMAASAAAAGDSACVSINGGCSVRIDGVSGSATPTAMEGAGGQEGKGVPVPGAVLAAQNAAASAKAAAAERRGFIGDEQKRARFNEFVTGFLSMTLFQAADLWLPLASGSGGGSGGDKVSRLFLYSSHVQDPALAKWSSLSRNVVLASGVGLPGIVFQEHRPQWAVDYSQVDPERNPLASVARLLGIGSAFGVPLSIGPDNDDCGVLMLYSVSCLPPSELMVEFMERATRLLLADAPAPTMLVQQFRDKLPSAKDIGRVAGAYQHHAMWAEHQMRSTNMASGGAGGVGGSGRGSGISRRRRSGGGGISGTLLHNLFSQDGSNGGGSSIRSNMRSSPELKAALAEMGPAATGWGGDGSALAVAAMAAASGGQGGGFRPDGGAVAFVPPPDWRGNQASPPPFLFNRVDLDSRPSVVDQNSPAAAAAVASLDAASPGGRAGGSHNIMSKETGSGGGGREGGALRGAAGRKLWAGLAPGAAATVAIADSAAGAGKSKLKARRAAAAPPVAAESRAREAGGTTRNRSAVGGGGGRKTLSSGGHPAGQPSTSPARAPAPNATPAPAPAPAPPSPPAAAGEGTATGGGGVLSPAPDVATAACRAPGCSNSPNGRTPFCWDHWSAARQCQHAGCDKLSQGNTRLCIAHGGGRRCTHPGCNKGARDRFFCAAHGGGKRCGVNGCGKAAVGGSDLCTGHGGGKRCQFPNCPKSAQSKTSFCVRHGGGRKCSIAGCLKVARGRTLHCAAHGGGVRCCVDSCNKAAVGRERMCRSHQRKSKTASDATASTAAAAAEVGVGPSSAVVSASRSRSVSPAVSSKTSLSMLSAAAATRGVSAPLPDPGMNSGGGVAASQSSWMTQQQQQHALLDPTLLPSAPVSLPVPAATGRPAYGGGSVRQWGVSAVASAGGGGGRGGAAGGGGGRGAGSRKRNAAMAMAGGGPADNMGFLRGVAGSEHSFRVAFPPSPAM